MGEHAQVTRHIRMSHTKAEVEALKTQARLNFITEHQPTHPSKHTFMEKTYPALQEHIESYLKQHIGEQNCRLFFQKMDEIKTGLEGLFNNPLKTRAYQHNNQIYYEYLKNFIHENIASLVHHSRLKNADIDKNKCSFFAVLLFFNNNEIRNMMPAPYEYDQITEKLRRICQDPEKFKNNHDVMENEDCYAARQNPEQKETKEGKLVFYLDNITFDFNDAFKKSHSKFFHCLAQIHEKQHNALTKVKHDEGLKFEPKRPAMIKQNSFDDLSDANIACKKNLFKILVKIFNDYKVLKACEEEVLFDIINNKHENGIFKQPVINPFLDKRSNEIWSKLLQNRAFMACYEEFVELFTKKEKALNAQNAIITKFLHLGEYTIKVKNAELLLNSHYEYLKHIKSENVDLPLEEKGNRRYSKTKDDILSEQIRLPIKAAAAYRRHLDKIENHEKEVKKHLKRNIVNEETFNILHLKLNHLSALQEELKSFDHTVAVFAQINGRLKDIYLRMHWLHQFVHNCEGLNKNRFEYSIPEYRVEYDPLMDSSKLKKESVEASLSLQAKQKEFEEMLANLQQFKKNAEVELLQLERERKKLEEQQAERMLLRNEQRAALAKAPQECLQQLENLHELFFRRAKEALLVKILQEVKSIRPQPHCALASMKNMNNFENKSYQENARIFTALAAEAGRQKNNLFNLFRCSRKLNDVNEIFVNRSLHNKSDEQICLMFFEILAEVERFERNLQMSRISANQKKI